MINTKTDRRLIKNVIKIYKELVSIDTNWEENLYEYYLHATKTKFEQNYSVLILLLNDLKGKNIIIDVKDVYIQMDEILENLINNDINIKPIKNKIIRSDIRKKSNIHSKEFTSYKKYMYGESDNNISHSSVSQQIKTDLQNDPSMRGDEYKTAIINDLNTRLSESENYIDQYVSVRKDMNTLTYGCKYEK